MMMSKRRRRRQRGKRIEQLNASGSEKLLKLSSSECTLELADQSGSTLPSVSMVAYTGAPMRFAQFAHPVIVNLEGLEIGSKSRPLLRDHDKGREIGHTTSIEARAGRLYVEGVISGENEDARRVTATAKNGFPYQASIGTPYFTKDIRFIRAGSSADVNGRSWRGPLYVLDRSTLKEVSVVSLGADDDSETRIAAMQQEGENMNFEQWLRAHDWDPEQLKENQLKMLRAQWEAAENQEPKKNGKAGVINATEGDLDDSLLDVRKAHADEHNRIGKIQAICEGNSTLCAQAIEEGWTPTKAELEMLKAGRSTVNGIARPGGDDPKRLSADVLEAAVMGSLGTGDTERQAFYSERTLEAADEFSGIGLQDLAMLCARSSGQDLGQVWGSGERWIKAAFSTSSLSNILENVLNKQALLAYKAEPIQALAISKVSRAKDFKQVSRLRLLGSGKYEKMGAGGEIPSGKMSDQKFVNQADTYGNLVFIDRQTMINDDLQMLQDAGNMLGQDGREVINHIVFTLLLANQDADGNDFFAAGNANVSTGAGSALELTGAGLQAALIKFRKQKAGPGSKAADKRPINITPRILLVPPELEVTAQILTGSNEIGAGANDRATMNPWKGRYQVVSAPHLSDTSYTGYSAAAWYLMAAPMQLPTIELLALNGRVEPNIERVNPPANQLGVGFRGYIDVGAGFMDPKGAVRSAGS